MFVPREVNAIPSTVTNQISTRVKCLNENVEYVFLHFAHTSSTE